MAKEAHPKVTGKLWAVEKEVRTEHAFIPQTQSEQWPSQHGTLKGEMPGAGASALSKDDTHRSTIFAGV